MRQIYILLLFSIFFSQAHAISVKDDHDQLINLVAPAKKVITLSPDLTEIIFAIGCGEKLVATVDSSDYPSGAKHIPRIGSYLGLDTERIVQLKPDLIVTWGNNFAKQLALFKKLGIPVYISQPKQLEDVARTMQHLGSLLGNVTVANVTAQQYRYNLHDLQLKYKQATSMRVFFQLGDYGLLTVNRDSWISQAIQFCGGENIFSFANTLTPRVTWESIIVANPQAILTDTSLAAWKNRWHHWQQISAVQHNALFSIPADWIDRPGPRLLLAVNAICQALETARNNLNQGTI